MTTRPTHLLLSAVLLLGITACNDQGDPTDATLPTSADERSEVTDDDVGDVVIEVRDNSFAPDTSEVTVGETLTWDFSTADQSHNVVFDSDRGSEILDEGTWSTSFDEPGTYDYECTLHPGMTGRITVIS